ncbi:hypothetical protein M404DRAFT_32965 [Pisolithus tinctorius Marx 270]|uniref:Uncharacterized protein n=1 Tax=Pisolithus tinctorius Marx 270 TaxID=870435 RepID=A0A0C3II73_PISTI|nr:hypothetical protein M404DRAFT_32965 [Pisolithus tinctorius Marx 270]
MSEIGHPPLESLSSLSAYIESTASSVSPEVFVAPASSSPAHLILYPFCFEFAPLDTQQPLGISYTHLTIPHASTSAWD